MKETVSSKYLAAQGLVKSSSFLWLFVTCPLISLFGEGSTPDCSSTSLPARSGQQEGRGGATGQARTGTHSDGSVEGGPAWGIPHGRQHPRRPYRGGDRVAPGVIAECPEPHQGGSTPLSLLPRVTTCPLHPALLEATLFTTPRPLANVWRHL